MLRQLLSLAPGEGEAPEREAKKYTQVLRAITTRHVSERSIIQAMDYTGEDLVQGISDSSLKSEIKSAVTEGSWSAKEGKIVNVVKRLIEKKADVNFADQEAGNTALMFAACGDSASIVKALLDAKADVNHPNQGKRTPLHAAAITCNKDIVKELLSHGAQNSKSSGWFAETPAEVARSQKEYYEGIEEYQQDYLDAAKVEEMILKSESSVSVKSEKKLEIAQWMEEQRHLEQQEAFRQHVNIIREEIAKLKSEEDQLSRLRELKQNGLDVHATDVIGYTHLHWAAYLNSPTIVEFLLKEGSDVNKKGERDAAPIHCAACSRHPNTPAIIQLLAKYGADLDAKSNHDSYEGSTPLEQASRECYGCWPEEWERRHLIEATLRECGSTLQNNKDELISFRLGRR